MDSYSKEIYKEIGALIRKKRKARQMSQLDLAKQLDVTHQQIHNYESGKSGMSVDTIYRIAILLCCRITNILPKD